MSIPIGKGSNVAERHRCGRLRAAGSEPESIGAMMLLELQ